MAINLVARMSLDDRFSSPMRRISRQMDNTGRAVAGLGRGMGSIARHLNPLNAGFMSVAAGATAAYGAVKIFNATVGEAMKMEQSKIVIGAMFDDKKLSSDYMKMMDKMSINSPLLDSQAMYGNSKTFVALSKDNKQLEKMWKLTEKLMASTPEQGVEGSVYALRQLFSGDAVSIIDRFNLDKNVMNQIKKLPLEQQMARMDEYMNKMGFTTKLIEDMGGTALGMWTQVKERFQLVLRDMGEPSLKAISKFFGGLLDRLEGQDMKSFAAWGGRVINSMVTGLSNSAIRLYDWFTTLANSEEFKSKSTLFGKVNFIIEDIGDKLQAWYDNGGKDKIMKFGSQLTETLLAILNNSQAFIEVGVNLGNSLAFGIMQGIENSAQSSKLGKFLSLTSKASPFGVWGHAKETWKEKGSPIFNDASKSLDRNLSKSHSAGLDRVPYNGYQPVLHKDEKILNAQEAREYRNGGKGGGVTISGNTFNVREEADINKIAMQLARLIETEGGQMV